MTVNTDELVALKNGTPITQLVQNTASLLTALNAPSF